MFNITPQDLSKFAKLSVAVALQKRVAFMYDGGLRIVEVHAIGSGPNGLLVRAFQVGGESHSTDAAAWRLFTLSKITNITGLNEDSEAPRPGYARDDKQMLDVFVQVPE